MHINRHFFPKLGPYRLVSWLPQHVFRHPMMRTSWLTDPI